MAEKMMFPDTWEKFEEQFGFYDSKQAYMYGNTRLIPSFRVEQWLDHLGDEKRRGMVMKESKMEAVAALFNKKVGEEFYVRVTTYTRHGEPSAYMIVKGCFNSRGFECIEPVCTFAGSYVFAELLEGKAVIIDDKIADKDL